MRGETTEPRMSLRSSGLRWLIPRLLRDPYSAKPYVLFYTTKRVGGGVQDFDAIKLLKFAVS
jgi:predicted phage gp36 major capsid-like protein